MCQRILLPNPDFLPDTETNFLELVETRQTCRCFSQNDISQQMLSYLLWCTQGVKMSFPNGKTIRNIPALHGHHPVETYILPKAVEDMDECSVYHFLPFEHALDKTHVLNEDKLDILSRMTAGSFHMMSASVIFLWSVPHVYLTPETETGLQIHTTKDIYYYCGHISQNLQLTATMLHLGVCTMSLDKSKSIHELLGDPIVYENDTNVNTESQYVVLIGAIGAV